MKSLREMIKSHDTGQRTAVHQPVRVAIHDEAQPVAYDMAELHRAELVLCVDYWCLGDGVSREQACREAEARLIHAVYGPLLDLVFQMSGAARVGDMRTVEKLADELLSEVRS